LGGACSDFLDARFREQSLTRGGGAIPFETKVMLLISSGTGSGTVAEPCGGLSERQRGAFGIGEVGRVRPLRPRADVNEDLVNGNTANAPAGYTFFVSTHRSIVRLKSLLALFRQLIS
jgi:hypothetical protein